MAKLIGQGMRERGDDTHERVAGRTRTRVAAAKAKHLQVAVLRTLFALNSWRCLGITLFLSFERQRFTVITSMTAGYDLTVCL